MLPLTAELLSQLSLSPLPIVAPFVAPLNTLMPVWSVDTLLRRAHFLAQVCHESEGFTHLVENLNYTHAAAIVRVFPHLADRAASLVGHAEALANAAYANRGGNGNEESGDGWKYRGRGLIQITFRDNYWSIGHAIERDLTVTPDFVSLDPETAVLTALAFWKGADCNEAADDDNITDVTRKINPALAGIADRAILKHRAIVLGL